MHSTPKCSRVVPLRSTILGPTLLNFANQTGYGGVSVVWSNTINQVLFKLLSVTKKSELRVLFHIRVQQVSFPCKNPKFLNCSQKCYRKWGSKHRFSTIFIFEKKWNKINLHPFLRTHCHIQTPYIEFKKDWRKNIHALFG